MPITREEHITYTNNELNNYEYYIKILEHLKNSKIETYLDIGANIGEYCNVLFEKVPSLKKAYLVEAEQNNFNFMLKHVKNKNVTCINYAIAYGVKNPTLVIDSHMNVGGFRVIEGTESSINVTVKTLEELKDEINLPLVDFVKIDIEGGEYNIIENSKYIQDVQFLDLEFHNNDHQPEKIREFVKNYFPNHKSIETDIHQVRHFLEKNI